MLKARERKIQSHECQDRDSSISDIQSSRGMQAENQLGPEWKLMRAGTVGVPSATEWLKETLPEGARVGIDPVSYLSFQEKTVSEDTSSKDQSSLWL